MGLFLRLYGILSKGAAKMNLNQLLNRYETIYLEFKPSEEEPLKRRLKSLGFDFPEKLKSPVKIHRNRTVSFITGFNEVILYSSNLQFKMLCPECLKTDYKKLSPENVESKWNKIRNKV